MKKTKVGSPLPAGKPRHDAVQGPQVCGLIQPYGFFVPRWMRLSHLSDDVAQEIALAALLGRTQAQRRDALRFRLRELRRTQWERWPVKPAHIPASLRPSKLAKVSGYRTNSAAHRTARQLVNVETRRAVARKGARARWSEDSFSNR